MYYMSTKRDGCRRSRAASASDSEERRRLRLKRAIHQLVRACRSSTKHERRRQGRIDVVLPVGVRTEDGRAVTLLSTNISRTGIDLISPTSMLGQKLRVTFSQDRGKEISFLVRIVWASAATEGLWQNGAAFLAVAASGGADCPLARRSADR